MASQSLVAFLAEAGSKEGPRINGEIEATSRISGGEDDSALCAVPTDACVTSSPSVPGDHAHAPPGEEVQRTEAPLKRVDVTEPDSAVPGPTHDEAVIMTAAETPFTEATAIVRPDTPSNEGVIIDSMANTVSTDAVASGSSISVPSPSAKAVTVATAPEPTIASSIPSTDNLVSNDSSVAITAPCTETLVADSSTAVTTESAEAIPMASAPDTGIDPPLEESNRVTSRQEEDLPPEVDGIQVPPHWHPKPCVHVSSIGGPLTEEELLPHFSKYGPIASVSFENERHDAALIRYDLHLENGEELLTQVRQATNSTRLGDKTLIVEPFRPDSLLFAGNLTHDIDDASLRAMFEPHGKVERAFVLRNAEGQSKCYGFVEYSLKAQAHTAKMVMGNINMDGRVLRVEWADCKRIEDMFSTVLFIDRLPREGSHIEGALNDLFENFGKIRDSHLALGNGNQIRGFAFIDFYHSLSADKAHQALDGYAFEGSNIRVSFANPSKSAQSYKFRYSAQGGSASGGKGGTPGAGMLMGAPPRGLSSRGPNPRGPTMMPLLPSRFMSPARPGMLGLGIGMQFGRGAFERGTMSSFHGSGRGMLGPNSSGAGRPPLLLGSLGPRAGMAVVENKLPFGQGAVSITPSAIVQVATAQARAREEEAKARAEAAKQGMSRPLSRGDSMSHYQKLQQLQHQNYLQQQQMSAYDQQYNKQMDLYTHQQASGAQQASMQAHQQSWNQQQHGQQMLHAQRMPHHAYPSQYPSQHYPPPQQQQQQQHHVDQVAQSDGYYQQTSQQSQQHGYASHYGQQQGYHYGQQVAQPYGQVSQQAGDQYQQPAQQAQAAYPQQSYSEQYMQQQQAAQQSYSGAGVSSVSFDGLAGQDAAQQAAYSAYYQQQAQVQPQSATNTEAATTSSATQQSYEAQWAAYYASQAAYQQQSASTDLGQKRSADQMDQSQAAYNYAQMAYQQQQQSSESAPSYQMQAVNPAAAYQQQAALPVTAYQEQGAAGYQQAVTGYEQPGAPTSDGSYQQPGQGVYDYTKRQRF